MKGLNNSATRVDLERVIHDVCPFHQTRCGWSKALISRELGNYPRSGVHLCIGSLTFSAAHDHSRYRHCYCSLHLVKFVIIRGEKLEISESITNCHLFVDIWFWIMLSCI